MSHDQVIKQMRADLEQLGNEVRNGTQHQTRNMLISAGSGAVFALAVFWIATRFIA
ncbi:hypothetical protein NJC38_22250 [Pseudomonas sp. 21LCFQ010]|uniref:hypothetical protein n=1 Tax=Pseudomonas sp. 21LCFQ010 TaxID=2957506 RepID=UPI002096E933|nr:hypothetical protein [Pseudomonas sp. 21LCFQ010]MCO8160729.1 hypothetical protein [Pseudomonas sp. 21LCFQ010]MCO8164864.1 hypothetical protein [Pseudomonas sp. 21LCFQ010]